MSRAASTRAEAPARPEPESGSETFNRNPKLIGYAMAVLALPVLLVLRHFGLVAKVPLWFYITVFVASPVSSYLTDRFTEKRSGGLSLNFRVALHVASVTAVIYMS